MLCGLCVFEKMHVCFEQDFILTIRYTVIAYSSFYILSLWSMYVSGRVVKNFTQLWIRSFLLILAGWKKSNLIFALGRWVKSLYIYYEYWYTVFGFILNMLLCIFLFVIISFVLIFSSSLHHWMFPAFLLFLSIPLCLTSRYLKF